LSEQYRYGTPAYTPTPPEAGFVRQSIASFGMGTTYQGAVDFGGWLIGGATYDPNYNPLSDIKGYEPYADRLAHAQSPQQMEWIKSQIDVNLREKSMNSGGVMGFAASLTGDLFDPINLVPIPISRGLGFVRGAAMGAVANTAVAAVTEPLRIRSDPTADWNELAYSIGGAALFGGALGGVAGRSLPFSKQDFLNGQFHFDRLASDLSDIEGTNIARAFNAAEENYNVVSGATGLFVDARYELVKIEVVETTLRQKKGPDDNLYHYDDSLGWVLEADRGRPDPRPVGQDIQDALGAPERKLENRMVLDEAAIKKDFEDGRTGLADGEVRTAGEYITFKQIEAVWKKREPIQPGETKPAYQARVRESALAELKGSRASASVARTNALATLLDKANFSPVAKALRLFKNDNVLGDLPLQLAGDYGWAIRANEFGYKTPPSLLLRAMRHNVAFNEVRQAVDGAYVRFAQQNSKATGTSFMGHNLTAAAEGLKTRAQSLTGQKVVTKEIFARMAGRAVFDQSDFDIDGIKIVPEAREAAKTWARIAQKYDAEARELGIFYDQRSLERTRINAAVKVEDLRTRMASWLWGTTGQPEKLMPALRIKVKTSDFKTPDAGIYDGFHGSTKGFTEFDKTKLGDFTGAQSAREGFFFSKTADTANTYTEAERLNEEANIAKFETLRTQLDGMEMVHNEHYDFLQATADELLAPFGTRFEARWDRDSWSVIDASEAETSAADAPGLNKAYATVQQMVNVFNAAEAVAKKDWAEIDQQMWEMASSDMLKPMPDGASVYKAKLVMTNPYVYDQRGQEYRERKFTEIVQTAKREGHDSVIIKNTFDTWGPNISDTSRAPDDVYVVFDKSQIVSVFDKPGLEQAAQLGEREVDQVFTGENHADAYINALNGDPNLSFANLPPGTEGYVVRSAVEQQSQPAKRSFTKVDLGDEVSYLMDGQEVTRDEWMNEKMAYEAEVAAAKPDPTRGANTFRTSTELMKDRVDSLTPAQRRVFDDWQDQLDNYEQSKNAADLALKGMQEQPHRFLDQYGDPESFFARFWNHTAIADQRERFRTLLTAWYKRDNPAGAEQRAEKTIDDMLKDGDAEDTRPAQVPGLRHLNKRKLDMPNSFKISDPQLGEISAAEFFNTDLEVVAEAYLRGMGHKIEAAKMFGDAGLWEKTQQVKEHFREQYLIPALKSGAGPKEIEALLARRNEYMDWIDLIQRGVMGGLKTRDPWAIDNRIARNLKNYQVLTSMGRVLLTSIPEAMRLPMVNGFKTAFGSLWDRALLDYSKIKPNVELSRETGELFDLVRDVHSARVAELNTPDPSGGGWYIEKLLQKTVPGFFKMVGLTHWTVMTKDMLMFGAQHKVMQLAKAVDEGNNAFKLASMGISRRDAKLLASMPTEQHGNLILPAVQNWSGPDGQRARTLLIDAIHGEARRAIVTPSFADRSLLFNGVLARKGKVVAESDLMSVPLQFMSYGIAASQKVLMSGLQGRDQSFFMGALAMMFLGMFSNYLKQPQTATMNKSTGEWLLEGYEASGVGAFWFSDLNQMIERYSRNTVGLRPTLGIDPRFGKTTNVGDYIDAAGPSIGTIYDVGAAFLDPELTASNRAQAIRRAVPYNNVIWWGSITRDLATKSAQPFK
jgi:hypothetical protein